MRFRSLAEWEAAPQRSSRESRATSCRPKTGLSERDIFRYALEFESHPDNLAAALRGGLVATAVAADGEVLIAKLSVADGVRPVVVIPAFELSTEKARGVLPQTYSRKDAVYNIQRSALTIAALTTGNWTHAARSDAAIVFISRIERR